MQLISTTITNFRSITSAYKVPLSQFTVLVGPNNEGKSNVLVAIVLALRLLEKGAFMYRQKQLRYEYSDPTDAYVWKRDFPVSVQQTDTDGKSLVVLEFRLTASELADFKKSTKVNLNTDLKLKVHFGREDAKVELLLQGRAKQQLAQENVNEIAKFVARSVALQYIPAIRTSEMAERVIERMLEQRLSVLEQNSEYQKSIAEIEKLQAPILHTLGLELTKTVKGFIPEVAQIEVGTSKSVARAIRNAAHVSINDGARTTLQMKGDGIKSLLAIALMKYSSEQGLGKRSLILAIEEPESHLHPQAIHRLREVLLGISAQSQVILTTHSAPLVDRQFAGRNVIVKSGSATQARSLADVRDALGVHQSDNLTSARLVLLLEGEEDQRVLAAWLSERSIKLKHQITNGGLAFDQMGGCANIGYKARLHKANICSVHAFLDHDEEARKAIEKAEKNDSLRPAEYTVASIPGFRNSELEDLVLPSIYINELSALFGFHVTPAALAKDERKYAWSERVRNMFLSHSKIWSAKVEAAAKKLVSERAANAGLAGLDPKKVAPFNSLVEHLESALFS
ncbi:MAG: ATP-dependent nuclease [Burkholderiaceae bacterium]